MPASPFPTARRLRAHALILALCLWSVYVWDMATPGLRDRAGNLKGTDFLHFYTLGALAQAHRGGDLYDLQQQADLAARLVPQAAGIRYLPLYPPQVAILFEPMARLSYPIALALWLGLSALLYGLSCYAVWRVCPNLRAHPATVLLAAAAFPAFWHLIAWGQTSALALACFTLALLALRAEQKWLAGIALGCLILKPQLALAAVFIFLTTRQWKIIAGAVASAALQLTAGLAWFGSDPFRSWIRRLVELPNLLPLFEPKLYQTHSLQTFWRMLVPWPSVSLALYLLSALPLLAIAISCWRRQLPLALRYSALLVATVLVAPHLTVYDLVILAPAFLLLANWIASECRVESARRLSILLYLAYMLPLLGPLARWTHFQLSVPVMGVLLYQIWRVGSVKSLTGQAAYD